MGKGSRARPLAVTREEFERRLALALHPDEWQVAPDGPRDPKLEYREMQDVLWCRRKRRR